MWVLSLVLWAGWGEQMETVQTLMETARKDTLAYERLGELCLGIGHRLSGSKGLEEAVVWGQATMEKDGADRVWLQEVMVPHWERGEEHLWLTEPTHEELPFLSFGGSVGGVAEGEVLVVSSYDELGPRAEGKIILFNIPKETPGLEGYGDVVGYRYGGATAAAEWGATGALLRSIADGSLRTPHTGGMSYGEGAEKIPYGAITVEDAERLQWLQDRGTPARVKMSLGAKTYPDALSHNVIGEIRGTTYPDEVVIVSGHLDAWDVGQGAHDDGAGVIHALETLRLIRELGIQPKRTIRAVLWTNEENGSRGGKSYADAFGEGTFAAIESDLGGFQPIGWVSTGTGEQKAWLDRLLEGWGLPHIGNGGGVDIGHLEPHGTLLIGLRPDDTHYFDYHHAPSDTWDAVDERELREGLAHVAALTWLLANTEE
ncbi:M20/M25/M40 family metallo-hydrolase [bacterium]|nr:M20/M25/M40 family metallo-hydrolase [bacterium]